MNPRLNVTQKTYYALGVLASVLNLAGGALYLAGIYAALLFNIASFLAGAMMLMTGVWNKPGVHNIEEFDPDPFMDALNKWGLPWKESFSPELVD